MAGLLSLLIMTAFMGVGSFAIGMIPLSITLSRSALGRVTTLGGGLLLGTALGVIIPEGVETIAMTNTRARFPSATIALSLLSGFTFMLLAERLISHWSGDDHLQHAPLPSHDPNSTDATKAPSASEAAQVEFDVELGELEQAEGITGGTAVHLSRQEPAPDEKERAYPLTLGLVVHALADGFALGSAAVSPIDTGLSFVVFLALVVHKAPTALALTTSLLATSLPRAECRKHLAIFSASTPVGAIVVYCLLSLVRIKSESNWTGVALLISGGSFLYVATVLQPGKAGAEDISERTRLLFLTSGMFLPLAINALFSHTH